MSKRLVSLRDTSEDLTEGRCRLQTTVDMRIGDGVSRWELIIDTDPPCYDNHGRPMFRSWMYRADVTLGEPEWELDFFEGRSGPRDVETIAKVFGVSLDARIWTKESTLENRLELDADN